jgi:hypothetical protein
MHFTSFCKLDTLLKIHFAQRPLERIKLSQIGPWFTVLTMERFQSSQFYPSTAGWARRRRWPAGLDPQAARYSLGAHLGMIGEVGRRGRDSGEGARRHRPAPATGACAPARVRLGLVDAQRGCQVGAREAAE